MTFPETTTPEALANSLGVSERRVRTLARRLGACRIFGNRMLLLGEDVAAIMEAVRPCPSKSIDVREALSGNIEERLPDIDSAALLAHLTKKPRKARPFAFAGHSSALGAWERTVERAGIEPLTFHSCRHGFATSLLRAGVDVVTIAKLGGWKSPAHVFQTYGHASDDKTLTDRIFDTEADTPAAASKPNQ